MNIIINLSQRVTEKDKWITFVKSLKESLIQSKCSESVCHDEDDDGVDADGGGGGDSGDGG